MLALASSAAAAHGELYPLDRIRMQKAVFLLVQRGSSSWRELYQYRAYAWGPYSDTLTSDMNSLIGDGLIQVEEVPGSRYGTYRATVRGNEAALAVWGSLTDPERAFVRTVRAYVTGRSFTELLREIYAEYPRFATASRFTG